MTRPLIGYITLYHVFAYFFIYAFLGWIAEVVFAALKTGKFVNRGFLNGPVCPIYGAGMALCVLLLNPLKDKWWLLFLAGGALATALEFITGFFLEKIFKAKWWDYSNEPFNIKGYVCLRFSLLWGLGILLIFYTLVPLTDAIIGLVPFKWWGMSVLFVFAAVMTADLIATLRQLRRLKKHFTEVGAVAGFLKAEAKFIGENVSEITVSIAGKIKSLKEKIAKSRIVKAFPKLKDKESEMLGEKHADKDGTRQKDKKEER